MKLREHNCLTIVKGRLIAQWLRSPLCGVLLLVSYRTFAENPGQFRPVIDQISQLKLPARLNEEWQELNTARELYIDSLSVALTKAHSLLDESAARITKSSALPTIGPGIDLWGDHDQETGFVPPIERVYFLKSGTSQKTGPPKLKRTIPARFRLAELLGIGKNTFELRTQFIDPRFQSRSTYGFEVGSRIQHELTGLFSWGETNQLTTFSFQIESRSRYAAGVANFGTGVKPHQLGLIPHRIEETYHRNRRRAWEFERLSDRLLLEGREIRLSQAELNKSKSLRAELKQQIEKSLKSMREAAVAQALQSLRTFPELKRLPAASARFAAALSHLSQTEANEEASSGLWTSKDIHGWVTQHRQSSRPSTESIIQGQLRGTSVLAIEALAKGAELDFASAHWANTLKVLASALETVWERNDE